MNSDTEVAAHRGSKKWRPENRDAHRTKMKLRREAQRSRVAGFDPQGDKTVKMFNGLKLTVAMESEQNNLGLKPMEIEQRAYDRLCGLFPPIPIRKRFKHPKPSKSDNPEYRKAV